MPRPVRFPSAPVLFACACTGLAIALVAGGCGYRSAISGPPATLQTSQTSSPTPGSAPADAALQGSLRTEKGPVRLAVISLRNDSPEPWLDRILDDALRREMGLRSAFTLVTQPADAQLVLRGRIRPLEVRSNSFSSFVAALEYEVTMELDLEVVRASGNVVRLDPRGLTETELYLASPDIESTRTNRLEALRHLADVLASRVADSLEMLEHPIALSPDREEGPPSEREG